MPGTVESPWLTKREAAVRAGCSVSTVERAIRAGRLRAGRTRGARGLVRVHVDAVNEWLERGGR